MVSGWDAFAAALGWLVIYYGSLALIGRALEWLGEQMVNRKAAGLPPERHEVALYYGGDWYVATVNETTEILGVQGDDGQLTRLVRRDECWPSDDGRALLVYR